MSMGNRAGPRRLDFAKGWLWCAEATGDAGQDRIATRLAGGLAALSGPDRIHLMNFGPEAVSSCAVAWPPAWPDSAMITTMGRRPTRPLRFVGPSCLSTHQFSVLPDFTRRKPKGFSRTKGLEVQLADDGFPT